MKRDNIHFFEKRKKIISQGFLDEKPFSFFVNPDIIRKNSNSSFMKHFLRLEEIKLTLKDDEKLLDGKIARILGLSKEETPKYTIVKKSIDSRDKGNILFIYSVDISGILTSNMESIEENAFMNDPRFSPETLETSDLKKHRARWVEEFVYQIPKVSLAP